MNISELRDILDRSLLHNSLVHWALALGVFLLVYSVLIAIKRFFLRRADRQAEEARLADSYEETQRNRTWARALGGAVTRTTKLFIFLVAIAAGAQFVELPYSVESIIQTILLVAFFIQAAMWTTKFVAGALERYMHQRADHDTVTNAFSLIQLFAKLTVWVVALLLILDNLGVNITALVAGLGVGGIAIALAAQNILADLFASLSIVLDKPFVKGDFIIAGDYLGTVEKIGLKTTRLRSLGGEQIICANTDLLGSRIRNYKRMWERRVVFGLGVIYQTKADELAKIPELIREAIEAQEKTRFDRAHFKAYGASSLDFEVVYYVLSPDYNIYMDIQHDINLAIFRRFEEEGLVFAYPTQTLYLNREGDWSPTGLPGASDTERAPRLG